MKGLLHRSIRVQPSCGCSWALGNVLLLGGGGVVCESPRIQVVVYESPHFFTPTAGHGGNARATTSGGL